ncbi:MAG: hypothetical protein K2X93_07445 [Candidatus Obscuribacterales bacterium]|nr:hypothetical protein [Candidatus Obscuribacterales bacterium]
MGLLLFYKTVTSSPKRDMVSKRRTESLDSIPRPEDSTQLSRGYRELSKNKTLAGREAARQFNNEDRDCQPNRLKMVSRLRHKEKFLIWRHVMIDLSRYALTGFNKFNPARVLVPDPYEVTNSAVRFKK